MAKIVAAHDFTIGWICALPIELAAATEMMDEEYADLPCQHTDTNVYSFGRVGVHNVVAACLPAGQIGSASAAIVATQMKSSFPHLRFGILVGIGGGVPNLDADLDIRLGDVVISQPSGQHGGVIQFDFGKTGPGGHITRTGSLNAPSPMLLTSLSKLHSLDIRRKTQVLEHLSSLTSSPNFVSPGPSHDILYKPSSVHLGGKTCKKCRRRDVVRRGERETQEPKLFLGNIASGNQAMEDGMTRDAYSKDLGGVFCFEREAAGLMNNFSCIVVRGICDYADAHKNNRWQPYAAATAAAYAKELLRLIPPLLDVNEHLTIKSHFMVPFGRNEVFVGREQILARLLERIPPGNNNDACQRTIVEGLGGIGKTQVTIEAAYRIREAYPDCSVFWVPALDLTTFENAYREIGRALKIQGIDDGQADVKAMVKVELSRDDAIHWLMIIDNADDKQLLFTGSDLMSYLPFSRKGSIVVTTRNHQVAVELGHNNIIHLEEMTSEEATELLHTGLNSNQFGDDNSTAQLLEHLAFLPLALRQASAYIACNASVTVSDYLGYCKSNNDALIELLSKDFNDQGRYNSTMNPIAKTWLISFEQISRDNELAAEYLKFICYLGERDIPTTLSPQVEDEMMIHEAISLLKAYSFIIQRGSLDSFDIHRLVRLTMQNWLQEQGQHTVQIEKVLCRLADIFPHPSMRNREPWIAYMPHVQAALIFQGHCPTYPVQPLLIVKLASSFVCLGNFVEAWQLLASLHGIEGAVSDERHQNYTINFDTAIQYLHTSFSPAGLDDSETLALWGVLGALAYCQQRYVEAEKIYRYVIDVKKTIQGADHHDVLSTMASLVSVLRLQGRYRESKSMLRRLIASHKKLLVSKDPAALRCLGKFVEELQEHDMHQESTKILQMLLKQQKKLLGPKHPAVLQSMARVALGLRKQGKHQESLVTEQRVLRLQEMVLGSDHPDTLSSMVSIAQTFQSQGQYQESEAMLQRVLKLAMEMPGTDPVNIFRSTFLLAGVLEKQGKPEAEQMYRQAIKMAEKENHFAFKILFSLMACLGGNLASQGRWEEAEQMLRQALKQLDEPDTPKSTIKFVLTNNLAMVLSAQEKLEEAEQMLNNALEGRIKVLGRQDPETLQTMIDLAEIFRRQGKSEEAQRLDRRRIAIERKFNRSPANE